MSSPVAPPPRTPVASPNRDAVIDQLQVEALLLRDPKANLVRRLDALYALKRAAFEVHPRFVDADRCRVPPAALQHAQEEHIAKSKAAAAAAAGAANHNGSSDNSNGHLHVHPQSPAKGCEVDEQHMVCFVVDAYHAAIDTTESVLLQHELLYNLGQMGCKRSIPVLCAVIREYTKYHEVSRHEAIEAIGAIGWPAMTVPALKAALEGLPPEALTPPITESADLAFHRLELVQKFGNAYVLHEHAHRDFCSVDPAPSNGVKDLHELRQTLLDPKADLFARYQAMFALRNLNSPKSVEVLCQALVHDKSSCLFRHEVAFVLGQMEYPSSMHALQAALANENEHGMVRHEAAEALGAIGNAECKAILNKYLDHKEGLVSDSCYAALQLMDQDPTVAMVKYGDEIADADLNDHSS